MYVSPFYLSSMPVVTLARSNLGASPRPDHKSSARSRMLVIRYTIAWQEETGEDYDLACPCATHARDISPWTPRPNSDRAHPQRISLRNRAAGRRASLVREPVSAVPQVLSVIVPGAGKGPKR